MNINLKDIKQPEIKFLEKESNPKTENTDSISLLAEHDDFMRRFEARMRNIGYEQKVLWVQSDSEEDLKKLNRYFRSLRVPVRVEKELGTHLRVIITYRKENK